MDQRDPFEDGALVACPPRVRVFYPFSSWIIRWTLFQLHTLLPPCARAKGAAIDIAKAHAANKNIVFMI